MKSILVDVMREAQGSSNDKDPEQPEDASASVPAAGSTVDNDGLQLMATTADLLADAGFDIGEPEVASASNPDGGADAAVGPAESVAENPSYSSAVEQVALLPVIGRYSPLIAFLLICTSAGSYFLLQELQTANLNSDLAGLSSISGTAGSTSGVSVSPEPALSPFSLRDSPPAAKSGAGTWRPEPLPQQLPDTSTATVGRNAGGDAPVEFAEISILAHDSSSIRDAAFADVNEAYAAYIAGDFIAAEAAYSRALEKVPNHPVALEGLAAVMQKTARVDQSLKYYEKLLALDPGNATAATALLAASDNGDSAAAETELKFLLQRHPASAQLHFALGTHYAGHSRWPEARSEFATAQQLDPENADYLYNLAVAMEHSGHLDDARSYYESALAALSASSTIDKNVISDRLLQLAVLAANESQYR